MKLTAVPIVAPTAGRLLYVNPGSTQLEAEYLFPLPEDAGVQNLVLMVDGTEARKAVEVILAVYKSALTKKSVTLPLKKTPKLGKFS